MTSAPLAQTTPATDKKPAEPDLVSIPCNLCGSDDFDVVFEAGVAQVSRIVKCRHCGLMYANPRGRGADLDLIKQMDPKWNRVANDRLRMDKERLQVRDHRKTRKDLREMFPDRGTLLEIGSSTGYLLDSFKREGWTVQGCEPWVEFAQFAQNHFGLNVYAETLDNANIPDASLDVVLMMHVIEHVPDPTETFRQIHRVLKPGGVFVMETPRYDSLMFKMLGKRERSVNCDGHIYFFTTDTLSALGQKVGFAVKKIRYVGRSLSLERLSWNVGVMTKSKAMRKVISTMARVLHLEKMWVPLNMRDMQRFYFIKPANAPGASQPV